MDLSELQALASANRAKHDEDCRDLNQRIEAENRRVHLRNALQHFGGLWSTSFMDSLPAERLPPSGEWTGAEWAIHRPEFDDWRTDQTMAIAADPRVQAWKEELLALLPNDIGPRNTALLMLQAAVQEQRDAVREIWRCMLAEQADDKERFPNSDPALLPSQVILWLKWKLAEELTQPAPPIQATVNPPPPHPGLNSFLAKPVWDRNNRELSLDGRCIKKFNRTAANQFLVLDAFQELAWPAEIDDPLKNKKAMESTPVERLNDTVKALNAGHLHEAVRFATNGTGTGISWRIIAIAP